MNPQDRKSTAPPAAAQSKQEPAAGADAFASKALMPPQMAQDKRKFRILCVDDDKGMRNAEKRIIAPLGHDVETAENGVEALERVMQGGIDLVVSDFEMPKMNGFELAEAVIKHDPGVRVMIVSGGGLEEWHCKRLAELGITHILGKPFEHQDLENAIGMNLPPEPQSE